MVDAGMNLFDVAGKTALITGGGSGLGQFMAKALAEAGVRVYLVGRRQDRLSASLGDHDGAIFALDLVERGAADHLFDMVSTMDQQPDIIVNAAGINPRRHADEISESDWHYSVDLNLNVPFLVSQKFVPHMKQNGWGRIINIASLAAVFGLPYGLDYVASKAAVIGMTRGMARELGPDLIRVHAVAPSAVMTEGTEEFFGEKFEKAKAVIAANQLIPRNLETEDLTGTIVYLASDASRFVTGQTHMVDGGSWFL